MTSLPDKLYFKIGEVCEICQIEPHVLRYWETEFSMLSPIKNKAGQRIYRKRDVELVRAIKHLLYDQKYTISGANKKLLEVGAEETLAPPGSRLPAEVRTVLEEVREDLESALALLRGGSASAAGAGGEAVPVRDEKS